MVGPTWSAIYRRSLTVTCEIARQSQHPVYSTHFPLAGVGLMGLGGGHTRTLIRASSPKLGNLHFDVAPNSRRLLTAVNTLFLFIHPKVAEKTWQTCLSVHLSHLYHDLCLSPFPLSFSQRSVHRYIAPRPTLIIGSGSCPRLP